MTTPIPSLRRCLRVVGAAALALCLSVTLVTPADAADRTSSKEARRVDRVKVTPKWYRCYGELQCATVRLPVDYDRPKGAKTTVALVRRPADDPKRKISSLFVNPGGPGGSGTTLVMDAESYFPPDVLERFDLIGMDPRGTNFSDQVACFKNHREQTKKLAGLDIPFPITKAEQRAYLASAKALAKACSSRGKPLSASMSTAQVARDMDVIRRAVGDKRLTYAGFSYGSYLGQVYANMFPDRVRAVMIDGILDPYAWAGTAKNAGTPMTLRLKSAEGALKALREGMSRCVQAGPEVCPLPDPMASFDRIAQALRAGPIVVPIEIDGEIVEFELTYQDFVGVALTALYGYGIELIVELTKEIETMITGGGTQRVAAVKRYQKVAAGLKERLKADTVDARTSPLAGRAWDFPYDNSMEAFATVVCTDSRNPKKAGTWVTAADAYEQRVPYFSKLWAYQSVPCAGEAWKAKDEDRYRGPFTRRTANPVLVVGNYWDPATNYDNATAVARYLPNSRLLSSDSWGHVAFGSSECVTTAMSEYLLRLALPRAGTVCKGDYQPYEGEPVTTSVGQRKVPVDRRAPVVLPWGALR